MTLSIDVLPAPFGPMMARISPLRMSKETSLSALTPPNASDTFSTDRIASPAATSTCPRALTGGPASGAGSTRPHPPFARAEPSRGLLHRGRRADVADRNAGVDHAFASVLECNFRRNRCLRRAVIERTHERRIALADQATPHLHGAGQFAIVGVELLGQDQEAPDLRADQGTVAGERLIHLAYMRFDHVIDERVAGEFLIVAVDDVVALRPAPDRHQIDVEHHSNEIALVAERNRFLDVGIELELVLDVFGREQRSVVEPADILGAVDDPQVTGALVEKAGVPGAHPAVVGLGLAGSLGILEVADEHARRPELHFAGVRYSDLDADIGCADRISVDFAVRLRGNVN